MPLPRLSNRSSRPGMYASPGEMNRLVMFYSPPAKDGQGKSQAPSPVFTLWGKLCAIGGQELDKAQQIAQKVTDLLVINYQLGILESMTFTVNEAGIKRTFQIAAIADPDGQTWQLKIYCFEINQNAGGAN